MLHEQSTSNNTENSETTDSEAVDALLDAIAHGATLKDIHGVPDKIMEGIYAHAYEFYQQGRFKDAEVFFRFLCLYDMYNADYIMGLAATLQQLKQYEKAIDAYTIALALGNDFRPLLHAGQCHLSLNNHQKARIQFTAIVESSTAPEPLKVQAQAYLSTIKETEIKEEAHV